jgi:hypothetical protein
VNKEGDDGSKGPKAHTQAECSAVQQTDDKVEPQMFADSGLDGGEHVANSTT